MRTKWTVGLLLAGLFLFSCLTFSSEQEDFDETALPDRGSTEPPAEAFAGPTSAETTTTKPIPTTTGPPTTATTTSPTSAPATTNPVTTTTIPPTTTTPAPRSVDEEGEGEEVAAVEEETEEEEGQRPPASSQEQEQEEPPAVAQEPAAANQEQEEQSAVAEEPAAAGSGEEQREPGEGRVHDVTVSTVEFMPGLVADIHAPTQPGNYPVVTLTFGRGWSIGDRSQMTALSHYLASQGMVAVNGEYRTLLRNGSLSTMAEEVACLAAAAPQLAKPHLTGSAAPVWLLGYSSGAHLVALAALAGQPLPQQCPYAPADIAGMVGLGGPYDLDELWNSGVPDYFFDSEALTEDLPYLAPVLRRGDVIAMQLFLRLLTRLTPEDTASWDALNPLKLADRPRQRSFLLITGDQDELIYPLHAERFAEALTSGGHHVELRIIPHTDHQALFDPLNVGEAIRSFVGTAP